MKKIRLGDAPGIVAHLFHPDTEVRGVIVIAPAMGVSQSFYYPLAAWLSQQGYACITFDYQGMGLSRHGHIKHCQANIVHWAEHDASLALAYISQHFPSIPRYWIGHSLGGQIFPMVNNIESVDKVITITSGNGYWRDNAATLRKKVLFMWYFLVPILTPLFGYFPGNKLGVIADLPRQAIWQWRKWCLNPHYVVGMESDRIDHFYQSINKPVTALSFSDDEMLSQRGIESLHRLFKQCECKFVQVTPQQANLQRIGHFGFFRDGHQQLLWEKYLLPELRL
ncbi:alpha/beta hydrolase family protein [Neptunicella sp.]|uniref:alpha/beta hydrolase family protein n=1 Tax=Neptunicella sp. TaxID=2125986 RepID=UPI003F68DBB0